MMDYSAWVGLYTFIGMFALLVMGVPIFICLLAAAFVGSWLIAGPVYTLQQFASAPYHITATYTFAVVPLFILMSVLAADSGVAKNAYDTASKWLGKLRGGLLMATVGSAAVFGAACGASIASAAVFSKTALPELDRCNYNKSISTGCIAVAGNLASLIPPSVGIIILVLLSEIALITPPIGLSAFLIAGVAKVSPEVVFKGVLPFFLTSLILLCLLVLFPELSLWLPDLFYGQSP